jgi:phosphopantetheinyl transferase
MIDGMTASESPLPDEDDNPASAFVWPDSATARRQWLTHGHVAAILDRRALPDLPPALVEERRDARSSADPAGFLCRRQALRALAGAALGRPPESLRITRSESGAPLLAGAGITVSLSGRPPLCAVMIGGGPAGIDIEEIIDAGAIPWNMLRAAERQRLESLPETARGEAFSRLWSAKEAYAKALGQGFRLAPESLVIEPRGKARFCPPGGMSNLPGGTVRLARIEPGQGKAVIIAVALLSS